VYQRNNKALLPAWRYFVVAALLGSAGFAGVAFLAFLAQPPRIKADTSRIVNIVEINFFIAIPFH
jgi:hypothetical protein